MHFDYASSQAGASDVVPGASHYSRQRQAEGPASGLLLFRRQAFLIEPSHTHPTMTMPVLA